MAPLSYQRDQHVIGLRRQADDVLAAQETPLSHLERELVEVKGLTGGHQTSANPNNSLRTRHGREGCHERAFKGEENEHSIVGRPHSDLRIDSTLTRTSSPRAPEARPRAQEVGAVRWHLESRRRDQTE